MAQRNPALVAAASLAAALLLALLTAVASPAAAQDETSAPGEEYLHPETPLELPSFQRADHIDPRRGVQFGLGFPYIELESEPLDLKLKGGKLTSAGLMVNVDVLLDNFRVGYARQFYRRALPENTVFSREPTACRIDVSDQIFCEEPAARLSYDSDQIWGFHGFRPHHALYLGYGLAWQHRLIRILNEDNRNVLTITESSFALGLMADFSVGLPFAVQIRAFTDLEGEVLKQRGGTLQFAFTTGF